MKKWLTAQNGLKYTVDYKFTIPLTKQEYETFYTYFSHLISYTWRIFDEGIMLTHVLNLNEELGKFGRFKDVPGQSEIRKYESIIQQSETYMYCDIVFLVNLIKNYVKKETLHGKKVREEIQKIFEKVENALKYPEIVIKHIVNEKEDR
ncbi:MAG: hypothetical protein ACOYVK_04865 [Bacillota bacterium]